jgi:hypothetical protein
MKQVTVLLGIISLMMACDHKANHQHDSVKTTVVLNNGERWEANPETTEGINNMINLVADFQQQSPSDYAALKDKLDVEFKTIFQKCTMKGEAHDQLHNYLIPLKKEIDSLSEKNVNQVESYLKTYNRYFQ